MVKSGIPVPAIIPDESRGFLLCVPDSPDFMGIVMGALKLTTFAYYWQGTEEQIEAVTARMRRMYFDYQEQVGCMICDMVAECFETGNEALIEALANAIRNNPELQIAIVDALASQGGATPGQPLTPGQSGSSLLPENVMNEFGTHSPNNLWGAMLYLVQSGNRIITDFFEVLEVASNTLESMEIVSKAIPAAGDYISAAAGFADQMSEVIAEGYAGAYTEAYEQGLACDLFCLSLEECDLSLDAVINLLNNRLSSPFDLADFGEIMAGIATGSWTVGDEIADVAFLVFFAALRFGQQFGDTLGIRPIPVLMSLGADQLASNNWEVLCEECLPTFDDYDFTISDQGFVPIISGTAVYVPDEGWARCTIDVAGFKSRCEIMGDIGAYTSLTLFFSEPLTDSSSFAQAAEYPYPPFTPVGSPASGNAVIVNLPVSDGAGVTLDIGSSQPSVNDIPTTWRLTKLRAYRS